MPSTLAALVVRVVFGTKNRAPAISPAWRETLHRYLVGTIEGLGAWPLAVGGTADHVHLLFAHRPGVALADLVREIKKASSRRAAELAGREGFAWQEGYGAFSVSPTAVSEVKAYIDQQDEHHRTRTFVEEFEAFAKRAGVAYTPLDLP